MTALKRAKTNARVGGRTICPVLERQREGIAKAKARGAYKGRKPIDDKILAEAAKAVGKDLSVTRAAKAFGVGKTTLYKFINNSKRSEPN